MEEWRGGMEGSIERLKEGRDGRWRYVWAEGREWLKGRREEGGDARIKRGRMFSLKGRGRKWKKLRERGREGELIADGM